MPGRAHRRPSVAWGRGHWPRVVALLAVGAAYTQLSDRFHIGPPWLLLALAGSLLLILTLARLRGHSRLTRGLGLAAAGLVTVAVGTGVIVLVARLPATGLTARELLRDAALLWLGNIVAFAVWYWEIDGGGPTARHRDGYRSSDFLFPQSVMGGEFAQGWQPGFVDYLFLAFTFSTTFSPADTAVLSRRAKALVMVQALLSIVVLVVLAARAVNTIR